jgi:prepilin signal peptidase PulO-like enzyme (type II secretory pathway)
MAGSIMMLLLLIPTGLVLGILLNYLADTLPYTRRLSQPVCCYCGSPYQWRNYLFFQPCENCGRARKIRHWLIPLVSIILVPIFWYFPPAHLTFWVAVLLLAYFTLVTITDLEYRVILDQVSLAGVFVGLAAGFWRNTWSSCLIGGAVGFGFMLLLYYLGNLFGRYLSRRKGVAIEDGEALGFGDVYLSGIIGLILGWPAITAGLLLGIILGGLMGGILMLIAWLSRGGYKPGMFIPYAPFLVLGAVILLYPPW